jgi:hypothetical protein
MKHSPAPWKFVADTYDKDDNLDRVEVPYDYRSRRFCFNPSIVDANGNEVVGCDEYYVFTTPENVRLMVHAPELLEALKWTERALDKEHPAAIKARQAIAKAEGA